MELAVIGGGEVGSALLRQLDRMRESLADMLGEPLSVRYGVVRHPEQSRDCPTPTRGYVSDATRAVSDPAVDIVVEVAGGREWVPLLERVVDGGRPVVTANKELAAWHGPGLRRRARSAGTDVWMEAAVGGAIPVLRTIELSWPGYPIDYLAGVLNGTANFVLGEMASGQSQAMAVAKAQDAGYAEADPHADLSGLDTQRKLAVLMQLAFGAEVVPSDIPTRGIMGLDALAVQGWQQRGYQVKLLAQAWNSAAGVSAVVGPTVIPASHPLGQLKGADNGVLVAGPATGPILLMGQGAGGEPTASAVLADVVAAARVVRRRTGLGWRRPVEASVRWRDQWLDVVWDHRQPEVGEPLSPRTLDPGRTPTPLWWWDEASTLAFLRR